jgi:hypothetical protein
VVSGSPVPTVSWGANPAPPVGNYTLTCGLGNLSAANYTFNLDTTPSTIAVVPAVLTVEPNGVRVRYGQPYPSLSYVVKGLEYGQTASVLSSAPVLTTTAAPGAGVGQYPISINVSGIAAPNYIVVGGPPSQLTINPAILQVRALSTSVKEGAPIPTFSYVLSGLTSGDTAAVVSGTPTITTTAVQGSPAGTYPITVNVSGMSAANYDFTAGSSATLTIKP